MNLSVAANFMENKLLRMPLLQHVISESSISTDLMAALDKREQERASFMALADGLVQEMRPEMEHMMTAWAKRSLEKAWRSRTDSETDRTAQ